MIRFVLSGVVVLGLVTAVAQAQQTLFIDFGDSVNGPTPPAPGFNYNHIFFNDTDGGTPGHQDVLSIANMVDSTGAPTGIGITAGRPGFPAESFFIGSNTAGTTTPAANILALFGPNAAQAARDSGFGHAAAFGGNPLTPEARVSLTGLNPALPYDLTIFASRAGVTDFRISEYRLFGTANGSGVLLDASNNTSNVALLPGVFPTAAGEITLLVDPGAGNNNASMFYYLGAMQIVAVPEPVAGSALLAFVAVASLRRRRA